MDLKKQLELGQLLVTLVSLFLMKSYYHRHGHAAQLDINKVCFVQDMYFYYCMQLIN